MNKRVKYLLLVLMTALVLFLIPACDADKKAAEEAFNAAVSSLEQRNEELDTAVASLQTTLDSDTKPLDSSTTDAAYAAIKEAEAAKVEAPDIAKSTEEITEQINSLDSVDYSAQLAALQQAQSSLEISIKQNEQVTNPSEEFVVQRLSEVAHVSSPTPATEDNDPNGKLHKQGGYTSAVFFASDYVNQSKMLHDTVIENGTNGGGCVEVFANVSDAAERNAYIGMYDSSLKPGSHHVVGTCVIRVSDEMTATQQQEVEAAIVEALTRIK